MRFNQSIQTQMKKSIEKFDKVFFGSVSKADENSGRMHASSKRRWVLTNIVALCLLSMLALCASVNATTNDGSKW